MDSKINRRIEIPLIEDERIDKITIRRGLKEGRGSEYEITLSAQAAKKTAMIRGSWNRLRRIYVNIQRRNSAMPYVPIARKGYTLNFINSSILQGRMYPVMSYRQRSGRPENSPSNPRVA